MEESYLVVVGVCYKVGPLNATILLSCVLSKFRVNGVALFIRGRGNAQQLRVRRDSQETVPLKRR